MFGLVLGALWRRRAQAVLLFILAVVATTGATAAPVYIVSSVQSLAAAAVQIAPNSERVVAAGTQRNLGADPAAGLASFRDDVERELNLPGFRATTGAGVPVSFGTKTGQLSYREDLCAHVTVRGACPSGLREIALSEAFADLVKLSVGDDVNVSFDGVDALSPLKVVGLYQAVDPLDPYWGRSGGKSAGPGERLDEGNVFTTLATFPAVGKAEVAMTVDLAATPEAFRDRDPQLHALAFELGAAELRTHDILAASDIRVLANRIFYDQQLIYVGVSVGAAELLLLCWFALFLAVSQTGADRRGDVGLLKMRGARRRDIWRLLAGQSLIPLVAGGIVGFVAGPLAAQGVAGSVRGAGVREVVWLVVGAATLIAVVGAVVAALVAERRMLSESVTALNRDVAASRRGWRAGIFDGLVLAVALAAAYQLKAGSGVDLRSRGLALLAPILLTLAVGVLASRLIPVAAGRVGRHALRSGRLSIGLAAMHLARRPGTSRVLGLVTVVVAVLCGTALSWSSSDRARHDRALYEVGDDRVLTVRAGSTAELVAAVKRADPEGRYAMAVVQESGVIPVLAVDASRLGAVMAWLPAYGIDDWQSVATALHPSAVRSVTVGPGALSLDITWSPAAPATTAPKDPATNASKATPTATTTTTATVTPTTIVATMEGADGLPTTVAFGPLLAGRHSYTVPKAACDPDCRLISLSLKSGSGAGSAGAGAVATLHSLTGLSERGLLADRGSWRADVALGSQTPQITAGSEGLALTVTTATLASGPTFTAAAFILDAPTPVPVVGTRDVNFGGVADRRAPLLDPTAQPVRVIVAAQTLPRIGQGALVDLEYADRLARVHGVGTMQVWLAAGAPADAEKRLADAGLTIIAVESVDERLAVLSAQAPPVALRFLLLVALVGVVLALISFAVMAAVERRPRGIELAALRRQGLRQNVVRKVAFGGYAVLIVAAVVIGFVTASLLARFASVSLPVFADGWHAFALPPAPAYIVGGTALAVAVVLGVLAAVVAVALASSTRRVMEDS